MDNRPIGVFDSGMGGLTALRQLVRLVPNENIIYFGDTGRVPYGARSSDTIIKYARQDMSFLMEFDPKAILIACGTVSTTALPVLMREYDLPVYGVVEPAVTAALRATKNNRIGIIGTKATVRSGSYAEMIRYLNRDIEVFTKACPLFVPLVEDGRVQPDDPVLKFLIDEYLSEMLDANVDTVILGCTHYPLLSDAIGTYLGSGVKLIDTGLESSLALREHLQKRELLSGRKGNGSISYYVSDSAADFKALASVFLGSEIVQDVHRVDIDKY